MYISWDEKHRGGDCRKKQKKTVKRPIFKISCKSEPKKRAHTVFWAFHTIFIDKSVVFCYYTAKYTIMEFCCEIL